ncbi:type VI secretion system-associated protein TagF [Niveispirillum sp. KHB5.9]|uniref:type VI secretion system-associated protein TagF n=1 Tax=Niveispirillum sp. KHB5.9 TaxID=3400269 RepID=UPI003A8AF559
MRTWSGTGLYGKLPLRGDFVTRGLPFALVDGIDAWLVAGLDAARAILAENWNDYYMSAPLWRFALPGGIIGPAGVAGILLPSVDAGGRHFPLLSLIVADLPPPLLAAAAEGWYATAEELLRSVLAIDADMARFDAGLAALPDPMSISALSPPLRHGLAQWVLGATEGLWWTQGSPGLEPGLFIQEGLPRGGDFATLMGRPPPGSGGMRRLEPLALSTRGCASNAPDA